VQALKNGLFMANIYVEQRRVYLGNWPSEREAGLARDRAILHLALARTDRLNFPRQARRLGPASPLDLRLEARRRVKASRSRASRYLGVSWSNTDECWKAHATTSSAAYQYIGSFSDEAEAALARDRVVLYEKRDQAILNFPRAEVSAASLKAMRIRARQLALQAKNGTSKYRGVHRGSPRALWQAAYGSVPKGHALGRWPKERDAALAHDRALLYYAGDVALLNFPQAHKRLEPASAERLRREAHQRYKETTQSRYRGVYRARSGRWVACIQDNYKTYHLGTFDAEEDAAKAYDKAALDLLGTKATLNFPQHRDRTRGKPGKNTRRL
jgi:hypothetical protein